MNETALGDKITQGCFVTEMRSVLFCRQLFFVDCPKGMAQLAGIGRFPLQKNGCIENNDYFCKKITFLGRFVCGVVILTFLDFKIRSL